MQSEQLAVTIRLSEADAGFIYTIWSEGLIESTQHVSLEADAVLDEGMYFGGSEVMD